MTERKIDRKKETNKDRKKERKKGRKEERKKGRKEERKRERKKEEVSFYVFVGISPTGKDREITARSRSSIYVSIHERVSSLPLRNVRSR